MPGQCAIYVASAVRDEPGAGYARIVIDSDTHGRNVIELNERRISGPRLELLAALTAAEHAPTDEIVTIITGSEYVHNGATKWLEGWVKNAWRSKSGRALKNVDLWERMLALSERRIRWHKDDFGRPADAAFADVVDEVKRWKSGEAAPDADESSTLEVALAEPQVQPERVLPMNYGGW